MNGQPLAVIVLLLLSGRSLIFTIIAILELVRSPRRDPKPAQDALVSIVIPAFNEAAVIARTLDSLLASDLANTEVIVVDDGSSDNTRAVVERYRHRFTRFVLRSHAENLGKAAALNTGIAATTGAFVATIDADTEVRADALGRCVGRLSATGEAAVACRIVAGRPGTFVEKLQDVEYRFGFNIERAAQGRVHAISVLPGAATVFRGDVARAWPFSGRTRTEDADHSLSLASSGYRLGYANDAIAETRVPSTCSALVRQRVRWIGGHLQCAAFHCASLRRNRRFTWMTFPLFVLLSVAGLAALASGTYLVVAVYSGSGTFNPLNLLFLSAGVTYVQRLAVLRVLDEPPPAPLVFLLEPVFSPIVQAWAFLYLFFVVTLRGVGLSAYARLTSRDLSIG